MKNTFIDKNWAKEQEQIFISTLWLLLIDQYQSNNQLTMAQIATKLYNNLPF